MTPENLLRTLRHRWWWLLAGLAVGMAGATIATALLPRTYTAEAALLIQAAPRGDAEGFDDLSYVDARIPTLLALGTSDECLDLIRARGAGSIPDEQLDPASLAQSLTFGRNADQAIITVHAEAPSARTAQQEAAVAAEAMTEVIASTSTPQVRLDATTVVAARTPQDPTAPDPLLILPLGGLTGLLIAVLSALSRGPRAASTPLKGSTSCTCACAPSDPA